MKHKSQAQKKADKNIGSVDEKVLCLSINSPENRDHFDLCPAHEGKALLPSLEI